MLIFVFGGTLSVAAPAAETSLAAGVWAVYESIQDTDFSAADDRDEETFGDIKDEALILYLDGHASLAT